MRSLDIKNIICNLWFHHTLLTESRIGKVVEMQVGNKLPDETLSI